MAVSTALSVAAFSVVLTETFVAVAASTLVPATFISLLRAMKEAQTPAGGGGTAPGFDLDEQALIKDMPGIKDMFKTVNDAITSIEEIELLVPKKANIHAEFEFEASEQYSGNAAIGGMVNVISVSAGYSALFTTSTRNKVTLDIEFGVVNYRL